MKARHLVTYFIADTTMRPSISAARQALTGEA
jgi:hypothetical protein